MQTECLISISVPGHHVPDSEDDPNWRDQLLVNHPLIKGLTERLDTVGWPWESVDTVLGWGNLNQDWIEFRGWVDTSWDWCEVGKGLNDYLYPLLREGKLIMIISYIRRDEDGNIVEHIPHH